MPPIPSSRSHPTELVAAVLAGLAAAALGLPAMALAGTLGWPPRPRAALVLAAGVGLVWGVVRVHELDRRALVDGPFRGEVVVTGRPNGSHAVALAVAAHERVLLRTRGDPRPLLGAVMLVRGRLGPLADDVRGYYRTQGVHLELRASSAAVVGRRGGLWGAVDRLHERALALLGAERAPPAPRALVAGVVLGEDGALPYDVRTAFQSSGLYHLVAVSGQNVALVLAFTLVALGLVGAIGVPARVAGIGLTVLYVLVTGAGPSIVRAGVAGTLVSLAWLASRPLLRWHALALGALVVLAVNPLELLEPGFQLSFAAVVAIFLISGRVRGGWQTAVAVSVACTIATTPIAWWHFGRLAPWSVPANLLALPAIAPLLWLGLTAILAGAVSPPLAAPLLWLADLLAGYVLWVARMFGS